MTDVARLLDLQFGLQSSTGDFSSTPGTVSRLLPRSTSGLLPRQRTPVERPLYSSDGRRYAQVRGVKDLGPIELGMEFRGMSNASGGAVTVQSVMEQARMLDSFFGTAASAITGAATTVTGGTPGSGTLTVTAGTNIADGDMVCFTTGSSAPFGLVMREVASGGTTTTLTLDRAYTGTPTSGATVFRAARWNLSTSTTHHTHGYFRAEGESWRRDYFGCAPSQMSLDLPDGGLVGFSSSWMPTDWTDVAEANPSYSDPTAGQPIVNAAADFRIAGVAFLLKSAKLTASNGMQVRTTSTGTNGMLGAVAADKTSVMLEGSIYVGDNAASIGELVDNSGTPDLDSLLGASATVGAAITTRDISLAVGGAANACMYLRIPAADFRGSVQEDGGLTVFRFEAMATVPSSGSPFRLGVF